MLASIHGASADPSNSAISNPVLNAVVAKAFAQRFTAGLAVAVVRDGEIIYASGFGYADTAHKQPVTAQTPFAIGSLTKQFTALIALQLVEEHRLSLDDMIADWLPMLPNARTITVRELLNQTSGLHSYPYLAEHPWPTTGVIHSKQLLHYMAHDRPDFAPGSRWEYSNTNYMALAAIEAAVTSRPYATLLKQRIFSPLQMTRSGFGYAAQRALHPAAPFLAGASGSSAVPRAQRLSLDLYSGAGGIIASASDLARWDLALLAGRLLNPAMSALWWSPGQLADGSTTNYGMGWVVSQLNGHRELWHNGFAPGAGGFCYNALFPDLHLGIVVLSNTGSFRADGDGKLRELVAALAGAAVPALAKEAGALGEVPAITARVQALWASYAAGKPPLAQMLPGFAKLFTPSFTANLAAGVRASGAPRAFIYLGKSALGEGTMLYEYRLELPNGTTPTFEVAFDRAGKIAGSRLIP